MKIENNGCEWNIKSNIGPISINIFIDFAFFTHTKQQYTQRHRHATFEFHFITEGSGKIFTDNTSYDIAPDCFYIVRAGLYHMQKGLASNPIVRNSFKFEFEISNKIYADYSQEEIKNFVYVLSNIQFYFSRNLNCIKPILHEVQLELKDRGFGYYTKVQQLFSTLFINIIRDIASQSETNYQPVTFEIFQENRINVIDRFFETNQTRKAAAQDLCQLIHISRSQLNRIMKDKYKMTFKQKHMETQIEHIKFMLINTDLPIGEIAEKFGYTSEGNFTAFVKHLLGTGPKAFRKLNREVQ